jgi:hypothetical protein
MDLQSDGGEAAQTKLFGDSCQKVISHGLTRLCTVAHGLTLVLVDIDNTNFNIGALQVLGGADQLRKSLAIEARTNVAGF